MVCGEMLDLKVFKVGELVVHQLPKRGQPAETGILSDRASPLVPKVQHFFEERVRLAFDLVATPITFLDASPSPVPAIIQDLLAEPTKSFVPGSQAIAARLFELQNKIHSEGLLCVLRCKVGPKHALATIKLEHELGVRAELQGAEGELHFAIQIIDDLMLTNKTKVFKVALFVQDGGVEACLCDNQSPDHAPAEYFLTQFLGCARVAKPEVVTQKFFQTAERFFNGLSDAERQTRYNTALIAEMNRTAGSVSARGFARDNLEQADRRPFLAAMTDAHIPLASFHKNLDLIRNRVRRIRFSFEGDVDVSAPHERMQDKTVRVKTAARGKTNPQVEAKLTTVKGVK
jgi:hypothetical protein